MKKYYLLPLLGILLLTSCNPFLQEKEAIEAGKKSDSILNEFNKVNNQLKESLRRSHISEDSITKRTDSLKAFLYKESK